MYLRINNTKDTPINSINQIIILPICQDHLTICLFIISIYYILLELYLNPISIIFFSYLYCIVLVSYSYLYHIILLFNYYYITTIL